MPAHYAHYRFGRAVLAGMPPEVRQEVQRFRRMFDMGLHGPDIFFYADPLPGSTARALGKTFHRQSGREFFTRACAAADSEAGRAYLYGLLAHYCLDSSCHPFVNKMADTGEAGHVALESEFDRYLMVMDGITAPHSHNITGHMKLTRGECMTVARFYPPATGAQVSRSVHFMNFGIRFLAGGDPEKREAFLRRLHPSLPDHMIPDRAVTAFARMDSELLARFNRCVKQYPELLSQLLAHKRTGDPLGQEFAPEFG